MIRSRLTTIDNPHDPFDEFSAWYTFDVSSGYGTVEFLGRIIESSDQLSEADQELAVEQAIDEIVRENVLGIYKKVTKEFDDSGSAVA